MTRLEKLVGEKGYFIGDQVMKFYFILMNVYP